MADLVFGQDDSRTPLISQPTPMVDISTLLDNVGQKPTTGSAASGGVTLPPEPFSNEAVMSQMQAAIDAVARSGSMRYNPYQSPDTAKFLDAVQRVRDVATQNMGDIDQQRENFRVATEQEKQGIQQVAGATIQQDNANQARAQIIADQNYAVNKQFGVDGNDDFLANKIGLFHKLNDQYLVQEQTNEVLKQSVANDAAQLREEANVNFLDDPIRWLAGVFKIPQLNDTVEAGKNQIEVLNNKQAGLASAITAVSQDINETVAASKDAKEARAGTIPAITAQQAAAANNLATAQATEKAAAADQKLAVQSSSFANQKFAEVVTSFNTEHAVQTLAQQNAELQWRSSLQGLAKADSDAKAKLMIVEMMTKINDNATLAGVLRLSEAQLGLPPNSLTISRYRSWPDRMKEGVIGIGMGYTGATPGDAYFNVKTLADGGVQPGPGLPQQQQQILQGTRADLERFQAASVAAGTFPTGKEAQRAFLIAHVNQRYAEMQANPTSNSAENPYYEQTPQNIAAYDQTFAQTKVGKILQPLITGTSAPDTGQVIKTLQAGAADTNEAAKMISDYYRYNTAVKNSIVDYKKFGLKPVNSYFYMAPVPGAIFGENLRRFDLTNPVEVKNMLLRQQKAQAMKDATIRSFSTMGGQL